ncbi:hypothetical protein HZH66_009041 [Vespula vulgaris]|uniref:Uncharacterized protein n=2 Tax=Vespula TaxID=7451 RepID=A0A834NWL4_VESPE|nr:hypothetical protein HZH66_009041 [Vespula vulgaris]KAF7419952.1 hypothetical protein H0235_010249 [Vespula pensylvanica]
MQGGSTDVRSYEERSRSVQPPRTFYGMLSVLTTAGRVNALLRPRPKKRSRSMGNCHWHWVKAKSCDVVQAQEPAQHVTSTRGPSRELSRLATSLRMQRI